ncbi:hypothetical protein NMK43_08485 [Bacillus licheniformis]|uniref:hypothetical protein n=1 Tax=Bacillus licheniformis TaxID=1402 RepID=UPI0020C847D8|nr:hypothetical protein [Bacillus licheniformis]MCP8973131.1 hypothetical protein [Bacillus licheniformis]
MKAKKYVRIKKPGQSSFWYTDNVGEVFEVVRENGANYEVFRGCSIGYYVSKEDAELIVTEKRPAKVGERVLITDKYGTSGEYKDGDILTADLCIGHAITAKEVDLTIIFHSEYEVIVNNEVKNEEDNELGKTYAFKPNLDAMGYDELIEHGEAVMRAISLRSYGEGYKQGKFDADMEATYMRKPEKTAQERRDEIVEQAKADVEKLSNRHQRSQYCGYSVEFRVNNEKRTIVVLLKGVNTGIVYTRGIAKAAPDDCFNVHIGKAIALHRALGLEVPDEYLNVPQPTEVREGDVVQAFADGDLVFEHMVKGCEVDYIQNDVNTRGTSWYAKIIDDSRTGSIES